MRERLFTAVLSILALALAVVIGGYLWSLSAVNQPGPLSQPVTVIIRTGTGLANIASQLADADIVSNDLLFQFEARRSGKERSLKPGEYRFEPGRSITAVIDKLVKRDVVARFVADGPTETELRAAKDNLVGGFALRIDTNRKLLDNVASIAAHRLPLDYLDGWTQQVEQVTVAQVRAAFERKLQPATMATVVLGATGPTAP